MSSRVCYEFGPFRLDPAEHLLLSAGKPRPLTPKAFDLLVLLVENQGRLIVKEEIMQAIWRDSFVEDANLSVLVSSVRKVLNENPADLQYIETIPKKGYRFAATVRVIVPAEAPPASAIPPPETFPPANPQLKHRRALLLALVSILLVSILSVVAVGWSLRHRLLPRPPAPQHRLAVLPLRNLKQDPDNDFLGFSLADAIITKLDLVSSLVVRPSSAIEKYKNKPFDIPAVAADLQADVLLTGTFLRDADHLRITYQLIEVKNDEILGKGAIDLKFNELLAVQDDVTRRIVQDLKLTLSRSEAARLQLAQPVNAAAYEYYLRGVDLMADHKFPLAIRMLQKSIEIDSNYAPAWAYLGQSYTSDATFEFGGREQYRRAEAAYRRALQLQPKLAEAEMFYANLLIDTGKVEQAVPLLRDALKADPNDAALHWELGYGYRFAGMLSASVAECERAKQIDPFVKSNGSLLNGYLYLGEYTKFLQSLPEANDAAFPLFYRGFAEYHQRDFTRASEDFRRAYQLDPTLYTQIGKAFSDSIAGKTADGLESLRQSEAKIQQRGVGDPEAIYKIAQGYAVLGDPSSALRSLEYSIETGFFAYPYFVRDPLLASLRGTARYTQLMDIARQRHDRFRKSFF